MNVIKKPLALCLIVTGALVVAGIWFAGQKKATADNSIATAAATKTTLSLDKPGYKASELRLSTKVKQKIDENYASEAPLPFDIEYIFKALSEVRVERNGNLVLDAQTLDILEAAVSKITTDLSDAELDELQELIALGLPGDAGIEAAKIFNDYYHYRSAEKSFLDNAPSVDIDGINTNFEQVIALRQAHLGFEVAEKLYGKEQSASLFMIKAMKIQDDPNLTDEEKEKQQLELSEELEAQLNAKQAQGPTESVEWLMRFENFNQEREYIRDSGLTMTEQERQITALLHQHFAPNEIDKARSFSMP